MLAIIGVLAALLSGATGRAYQRVKSFAGEVNSSAHLDELRTRISAYAAKNPDFPPLTLEDVVKNFGLSSGCVRFLRSKEVTFHDFSARDPDDQIVILINLPQGKSRQTIAYQKLWAVTPPDYAN